MFCQLLLDAQDILGAIHAEVRLACLQQTDFKTVLQGSQLLEGLRSLERRGRKGGESSKHTSLVTVKPDVPLSAGQRCSREVEGRAIESGDDLDDVSRAQLLVALEGAGE